MPEGSDPTSKLGFGPNREERANVEVEVVGACEIARYNTWMNKIVDPDGNGIRWAFSVLVRSVGSR